MYQVRILDKNKQLKATLPGVRWYYKREINAVGPVEVYIPKTVIEDHIPVGHSLHDFFHTQSKLIHAEIASFVQVYKGNRLVVSGKITGRALGQVVTVFAATEEILLESIVTPAQYGAVWDGWDLADVARDLLDGWQTLRVKAPEQWQSRIVERQNVDFTTDPGKVMLAKRSDGRYHENGYLVLKFAKTEVLDFKEWDRVRWSADSDGMDNPDAVVWTSIQVSTNGTQYSAPFDGGLPEEVGYVVTGDSDSVWIRINLHTNDTESPAPDDPDEKPIGQTPVVYACEMIARTHGELVAGSIPAVAGETVSGISASHTTALKVLLDACDQAGWEFVVWDGALNLAESLGVDRAKEFVFRAATNIEIESLSDGDDELVNILTAYGPGDGINRMVVTLTDAQSILTYGPYPNREPIEFNAETYDELLQKAQEYLEEHSQPKPEFAIQVVCEYDREPEYGLGDRVRVADPDTGIITTTRIVEEEREFSEDGLSVRLKLGRPSFSLTEVIGRDGKDGRDGKPGPPGRPGAPGPPGLPGEVGDLPDPADPQWIGYHLSDALYLSWYKAEFATGYEIRTDLNWGSNTGLVFRGYAHTYAFVPLEREMILYIKSLNAVGKYSENYDTLNVSLPAPQAPDQPTVEAFFTALKIKPTPLSSPAVRGYYIYIAGDGIQDKVPVIAGGTLTYPLQSGTTVTIQVSAYDVLGEGGKSEPLQATTTALSELDIPDNIIDETKLTESLRQVIEENKLGDIPHRLEIVEAELDEEIEGSVKSQVLQLADEITLKVQRRTSDGKLIVTGMGVAIGEDEQSEVAVLADRFRILGDIEGESQPVFAVDTQTQKVYILGDLIAEGLIRATDVQAEVAKHLLLQAELAYLDEANVLHLRADKITVGGSASPSSGIPLPKPSGSHVWHYDKHLSSTDGIGPTSANGALIVGGRGIAGGSLKLESGGAVAYALPGPVSSYTWAGFYEEG